MIEAACGAIRAANLRYALEGLDMQFVNQLLQLLQQGLSTVFHFIGMAWQWTITQISAVPWNRLDQLSILKILVLVLIAGGVGYLLYRAGKELLEAGEKLLNAFVTLLSVFVRTLPFILLAGVVAAAGAWLVNHGNF
jgi:hypothetical protein